MRRFCMLAIDEFGIEFFIVSPFSVKELDILNKNLKDKDQYSFTREDFDTAKLLENADKIFEYYYQGEKIKIFHSYTVEGYFLVGEKVTFEYPNFISFYKEICRRDIRTVIELTLLSKEQMREIREETRRVNEALKNKDDSSNEVKTGNMTCHKCHNMTLMRKEKLLSLACKPLINWTLQDYATWCHNYNICNADFITEKGKYPCIFRMNEPDVNGGTCIWKAVSFRDMVSFKNFGLDKKREEFFKALVKSMNEDEE